MKNKKGGVASLSSPREDKVLKEAGIA